MSLTTLLLCFLLVFVYSTIEFSRPIVLSSQISTENLFAVYNLSPNEIVPFDTIFFYFSNTGSHIAFSFVILSNFAFSPLNHLFFSVDHCISALHHAFTLDLSSFSSLPIIVSSQTTELESAFVFAAFEFLVFDNSNTFCVQFFSLSDFSLFSVPLSVVQSSRICFPFSHIMTSLDAVFSIKYRDLDCNFDPNAGLFQFHFENLLIKFCVSKSLQPLENSFQILVTNFALDIVSTSVQFWVQGDSFLVSALNSELLVFYLNGGAQQRVSLPQNDFLKIWYLNFNTVDLVASFMVLDRFGLLRKLNLGINLEKDFISRTKIVNTLRYLVGSNDRYYDLLASNSDFTLIRIPKDSVLALEVGFSFSVVQSTSAPVYIEGQDADVILPFNERVFCLSGLNSRVRVVKIGLNKWDLTGGLRVTTSPPSSFSRIPGCVSQRIASVTYGNGYWVAVGNGFVCTISHPDPTKKPWIRTMTMIVTYGSFTAVVFGNERFLLIRESVEGHKALHSSNPSSSWGSIVVAGLTGSTIPKSAAFGNGRFFIGAVSGILTSTFGQPNGTWSVVPDCNFPSINPVSGIVYQQGFFLFASGNHICALNNGKYSSIIAPTSDHFSSIFAAFIGTYWMLTTTNGRYYLASTLLFPHTWLETTHLHTFPSPISPCVLSISNHFVHFVGSSIIGESSGVFVSTSSGNDFELAHEELNFSHTSGCLYAGSYFVVGDAKGATLIGMS
ncbi:hypothetical protein RCL1_003786 [Eukaryota sp. TZLM3-RCL]